MKARAVPFFVSAGQFPAKGARFLRVDVPKPFGEVAAANPDEFSHVAYSAGDSSADSLEAMLRRENAVLQFLSGFLEARCRRVAREPVVEFESPSFGLRGFVRIDQQLQTELELVDPPASPDILETLDFCAVNLDASHVLLSQVKDPSFWLEHGFIAKPDHAGQYVRPVDVLLTTWGVEIGPQLAKAVGPGGSAAWDRGVMAAHSEEATAYFARAVTSRDSTSRLFILIVELGTQARTETLEQLFAVARAQGAVEADWIFPETGWPIGFAEFARRVLSQELGLELRSEEGSILAFYAENGSLLLEKKERRLGVFALGPQMRERMDRIPWAARNIGANMVHAAMLDPDMAAALRPLGFMTEGLRLALRPVSWEQEGVYRELAASLAGLASVQHLGLQARLEGDRANGTLTKEGNTYVYTFDHPHTKREVIDRLRRTLFNMGGEHLQIRPNWDRVIETLAQLEPRPPQVSRSYGDQLLPPVSVYGTSSLEQFEAVAAAVATWDLVGGAKTAEGVTPIYVLPLNQETYTRVEPVRRQEPVGQVSSEGGPAFTFGYAEATARLDNEDTVLTGWMLSQLPGTVLHEFAHHLWVKLKLAERPNNPMGKGDLSELTKMGYARLPDEDYARVHERFFELLPRMLSRPAAHLYNRSSELSEKLRFVLREAYGVPLAVPHPTDPHKDPSDRELRALLRQHFSRVPRHPDDEAMRAQIRRHQTELEAWLYDSRQGPNKRERGLDRRERLNALYGIELPPTNPGQIFLRAALNEFIS
jgi:hypothetical protein